MKRVFSFILLFVLVSFQCIAQDINISEKSLLWEVSGKGLNKPSYVLGTFHILCKDELIISDKVQKALDSAEQLALEVNFSDPVELAYMQKMFVSEQSLSSQLSQEELAEFGAILKEEYNLELEQVNNFSTIALVGLMMSKLVSCEVKGYDLELFEKALQANKSIIGLEHFIDQQKVMESMYSPKELVNQFKEVNAYKENYNEMKQSFLDEDIEALYEFGTDPKFVPTKFKKDLLDNRNIKWVAKMPEIMKEKSTVFAVGSAHLGGEYGVLKLLEKEGYQVKAVYN
ncbi:TraB/GumN family protein [Myroides odoratimimus]|uniref:TraB/GumN family protein n=1 Tax=Myroides odoratimimus TaxID=76832 RepID=UPI0025773D7D|nr:TraB/GumN family protein [Myroides odoratimimus]MDM1499936.1 TraB/GumN family protein [Myroides odoratimimus]MDM1507425.1 TraB/GumN family protein [Myroides odoratimimus]MDM1514256.1 TraB/GumN family protein [Myroides odoratimimus]MDM1517756.1 TraB/GumN family protein [Myroides odoratimimus]